MSHLRNPVHRQPRIASPAVVAWMALFGALLLLAALPALADPARGQSIEPFSGAFEHWDRESGTITVEGSTYQLTGNAVRGVEKNGRIESFGTLEPGTYLVLHPVRGSNPPAVHRLEIFEPKQ
jgi:hypothetical protein